jgi:hypothetical protein
VDVGVADAAVENVDQNVVGLQRPAFENLALKRLVDGHGVDDTITRALIEEGIRRGYVVTVSSGGDGPDISRSSNADEIMEHARAVDQCTLTFRQGDKRIGAVFLVFGEYGWDVICDHTDNEATNAMVAAIEPIVADCERKLDAAKAI